MIKKLQARGEARKGRGFGFVTLASEELQQKAVSEMNGKEIEGREIAVKVAIDSPDKTDDDHHEGAVNGQKEAAPATEAAPAAGASAPATAPAATPAAAPAAAEKKTEAAAPAAAPAAPAAAPAAATTTPVTTA